MRIDILLFVTVVAVLLSNCNRTQKNKETFENKNSDPIKIQYKGTEKFFIKDPKFKIKLYGISENIQDHAATLITEQKFEHSSVPFAIELYIPKDTESKISPKPTQGIHYYISMEWDSDGNGKINEKGDIFIDYDKKFPYIKLNNKEEQIIYLKILK